MVFLVFSEVPEMSLEVAGPGPTHGRSNLRVLRLAADPKDTERAIRPDSPRSEDSAPHPSDNEFIDDAERDHDEDFSMYYRVDTQPDL